MKLTQEQFDALKAWMEAIANRAACGAVHQPAAKDDTPEWYAHLQLVEGAS